MISKVGIIKVGRKTEQATARKIADEILIFEHRFYGVNTFSKRLSVINGYINRYLCNIVAEGFKICKNNKLDSKWFAKILFKIIPEDYIARILIKSSKNFGYKIHDPIVQMFDVLNLIK